MTALDLHATCEQLRVALDADVHEFEGKTFTGANVAVMVGRLYGRLDATLSLLANVIISTAGEVDAAIDAHCANSPHIYADGSTS